MNQVFNVIEALKVDVKFKTFWNSVKCQMRIGMDGNDILVRSILVKNIMSTQNVFEHRNTMIASS